MSLEWALSENQLSSWLASFEIWGLQTSWTASSAWELTAETFVACSNLRPFFMCYLARHIFLKEQRTLRFISLLLGFLCTTSVLFSGPAVYDSILLFTHVCVTIVHKRLIDDNYTETRCYLII